MFQDAFFLRVEMGDVLGDPLRRIEEQRLRAHIGLRSGLVEQRFPDLEAAPQERIGAAPAVDDGEAAQAFRLTQRQLDADNAADGVADDMRGIDVCMVEHAGDVVGHAGDAAIASCAAAGADVIVENDLMALGERIQLRRPERAAAAHAGREQNRRTVPVNFVIDLGILAACKSHDVPAIE